MRETRPTAATVSRLDLKTLRLFAAICEAGTLNGAARRAAIAPSAVSKRLAELERALGCALLTR
ncbi:LysR family transcriptional regulator, partial [Corallococcus exiguus]|nr:LysR family transcriptional regulator [Corallococcus exiguus]